jgi:ribA/ribD-fused uncharacterized protein
MQFRGKFYFLSNFYPVNVYGYPSVEHAYQAAKTLDKALRAEIKACKTPAEAKRLGGKLNLRPDWEEIKLEVMETLLKRKFENPQLRSKLLETGSEPLVEENTWHDNFWGCCQCSKCGFGLEGANHLGKLLMNIRGDEKKTRRECENWSCDARECADNASCKGFSRTCTWEHDDGCDQEYCPAHSTCEKYMP